jgi:hypothetical protein
VDVRLRKSGELAAELGGQAADLDRRRSLEGNVDLLLARIVLLRGQADTGDPERLAQGVLDWRRDILRPSTLITSVMRPCRAMRPSCRTTARLPV